MDRHRAGRVLPADGATMFSDTGFERPSGFSNVCHIASFTADHIYDSLRFTGYNAFDIIGLSRLRMFESM